MSQLILFSDRISHPARACLLLLRNVNANFQESNVELFKGQHMRHKELPFKRVPVLKDGNVTIAESTSILRYGAQKFTSAEQWYPSDLAARAKTDEFLDYFQSSMNANIVTFVRNKMLYKLALGLKEPNTKVIGAAHKQLLADKQRFFGYFLGDKKFLGGDHVSIADLLASCSIEQLLFADADGFSNSDDVMQYIQRVKDQVKDFDEVHEKVRKMPQMLKQMSML